jgi:hypothetical protein
MARRGGPALYELLDKSKGSAPPGAIPSSARLDPKAMQSLVIAVVVVAAVVTAYLVGVSRGRSTTEQSTSSGSGGSQLLVSGPSTATPRSNGGSNDGSRASATPENSASNQSAVQQNGLASNAGSAENSAAATGSSAALGPAAAGDPRQAGLSYFVLCSTLEANALKVVDFCRSKGLDAYVVPDQNGRLREVTVLPGFEAGERSSPAIKELEERIRKVGVSWKASGPGNSDFGDRYIKTHR